MDLKVKNMMIINNLLYMRPESQRKVVETGLKQFGKVPVIILCIMSRLDAHAVSNKYVGPQLSNATINRKLKYKII